MPTRMFPLVPNTTAPSVGINTRNPLAIPPPKFGRIVWTAVEPVTLTMSVLAEIDVADATVLSVIFDVLPGIILFHPFPRPPPHLN